MISFLTSPEGQTILLKHNIGIPILKSMCQGPLFLDPTAPPKHKEIFLKTFEYGKDIPSLRNFQEAETAMGDELQLGFIGEKPASEVCPAAARAADKLLAENKE